MSVLSTVMNDVSGSIPLPCAEPGAGRQQTIHNAHTTRTPSIFPSRAQSARVYLDTYGWASSGYKALRFKEDAR